MLHGRVAAVQVLYTVLLCPVTGTEGICPGITITRRKVQASSNPQSSTALLAQYPRGRSSGIIGAGEEGEFILHFMFAAIPAESQAPATAPVRVR